MPPGRDRPRRPAHLSLEAITKYAGTTPGPAEVTEVAHHSAAIVLGVGRTVADPDVTARLVALVDELGLDTIAELWSVMPAGTLPGALWRLYALREWVGRSPTTASREYAAGMRHAQVNHVVAGPAEPPGPDELRALVDEILRRVYRGDLAVALERAAAFCRVISAGRAELAHDTDAYDPQLATRETEQAATLLTTARDLDAAAAAWRAGALL
ncbi:MAG: hypothetical protein LKG20_06395 [Tetrasphaera jenkinsii]|jgi:hypothetical protein|nr:hypothetical protein [Tetrasphaera jenkinsii]